MIGHGSTLNKLSEDEVQDVLAQAFDAERWDGKRVLVIIPDETHPAVTPLIFHQLYTWLGWRVERLDYMVALGMHPPLTHERVARLVGVSAKERVKRYPKSEIFNHTWGLPGSMSVIGAIDSVEMATLSDGLMTQKMMVTANNLIFDYDHLIICGPVFPYRGVGFCGGGQYLFPGIAGPETVNAVHWLGALTTNMKSIGQQDTPVRRVLQRAVTFIAQKRPLTFIAQVLAGPELFGLYVDSNGDAWTAAAELSAQLDIVTKPRPFHTVLSMPDKSHSDLWMAINALCHAECVVADGGELIIYAPHISEISYAHGHQIRRVGYHVRDYFLKQWSRFEDTSLAVLAHAAYLKGQGAYEGGVEKPRIQVTLATGIPELLCRHINLGYCEPTTIDPAAYANREAEGVLLAEQVDTIVYHLR